MREMEIAMRGDCFSKTRGLIQNNLLGVMIASALMIPVTAIGKVIDIDDVGNEVVGPIDSIVRILNLRSCITDAEYKEMASEARALYQQLLRDIADVIEIDSRPETTFAVGALDRAGPRIKGFQDRLSRLLKELNSFPRCAPGVVPETRVGWFIGGHFVKSWQDLKSAEVRAATGQVTNQFSDNKDPLGFGIVVGAKFTPWSNSIVVGPFVSLDYLNMSVNHNFAGGSFLGTTSNYAATAGVKLGPTLPIGAWIYGIAGVGVLNETLRVNFLPAVSATTTTVPGATLGFGGAIEPKVLQGFGRPVSIFVEYHHTWWRDAQFNTPAASPPFNYNFRRQDDVIKFGFMVSLDPLQATAPSSTYPVKAPRLK